MVLRTTLAPNFSLFPFRKGVVFYAICKSKYKEDFGSLVELISDEDSATLMPEADEEELDEVIDHAIDVVLGV